MSHGPEMQYKENQGRFVSRVDEEPFSNNMSNCSFHFPFTVVGTSASSGTVVVEEEEVFSYRRVAKTTLSVPYCPVLHLLIARSGKTRKKCFEIREISILRPNGWWC